MSEAPGPRNKVLVPVNFSQKSEMALEFALQYTRDSNSEVYLFHVLEDSTDDFRRLDRLNIENTERMKTMVLHAIERLAAKGMTHSIERVHRRLAHGKPATQILEMAENINADIIVMGSSDEGAFKKLFMRAPCTIVLVTHKKY